MCHNLIDIDLDMLMRMTGGRSVILTRVFFFVYFSGVTHITHMNQHIRKETREALVDVGSHFQTIKIHSEKKKQHTHL
jgi:hypothetical protein